MCRQIIRLRTPAGPWPGCGATSQRQTEKMIHPARSMPCGWQLISVRGLLRLGSQITTTVAAAKNGGFKAETDKDGRDTIMGLG
jgi:hypothetical protein